MSNPLKRQWQSLTRGRPGHRFQARYDAGRKARANAGAGFKFLRAARLLAALASLAVGVVLVFIPGPAILFFFLTGSLLAAESLKLARLLDWLELKCRAGIKWSRQHWAKLHGVGKVAVSSLALLGAAGGAYLAYRFVAG